MKIQMQQPMSFFTATPRIPIHFQQVNEAKDTVTIGSQAKQLFQESSVMERLLKQRDQLLEMKNKATEGEDSTSLQQQMKAFDEQLAELDAQIAQVQKEEREKDGQDSAKQAAPKIIDEVMFAQASSLEKAKTLQTMDRSLTREKETLESEMKLDAQRGVHSEYKANRLTTIEDQRTFVDDSIAQHIDQTLAKNEEQTLQQQLENEE